MLRKGDQMGRTRGGNFTAVATMLLLVLLSILALAAPCQARMEQMTDVALDGVTGAGFSSFTFVNGVAVADFPGVSAATYTEIDSLKLGYWDKGTGNGWDQNWTTVKLGSATEDLVFNGFFIKAEFEPATVNDSANRQLKSFSMGSKDVTGVVSANFQSFSGVIGGGDIARDNLGTRSYRFNHTELSFSLELSGAHKGIWVNMGTATQI